MNFATCITASKADPMKNRLLAALSEGDRSRWLPHLETVSFAAGQVLCESSTLCDYVYFPTTAVVSLVSTTAEGGTSEVAVVGNDGVVGIGTIMGGRDMPLRAVVQSAGQTLRMRSHFVKAEADRAGPALQVLLRYAQSLITQVMQTAACNRHHGIEQQLARRLLMALDRSIGAELTMTQEGVAGLLGVRREGVTAAALKLQQAGVIRYQRGHISVLDRNRLEQRTCECYAAVVTEQRRLLPTMQPSLTRPEMLIAA